MPYLPRPRCERDIDEDPMQVERGGKYVTASLQSGMMTMPTVIRLELGTWNWNQAANRPSAFMASRTFGRAATRSANFANVAIVEADSGLRESRSRRQTDRRR